jgi:4-amino-4-deoxy-L-arabinose transferase-like glycosyltransferase
MSHELTQRPSLTSRLTAVRRISPGDALRRTLAVARRVPAAAWLCALVACLNAATWSVISPPFQVIDEPEHVAYVVQLAAGRLPTKSGEFSLEEAVALHDTHLQEVAEEPEHQTISSNAQQEKLQSDLKLVKDEPNNGGTYAGVAASQPPLYYALETIPYSIGAGGTLLDRIQLMRLLSALMGGLTALFTFLFVREALPRVRWAWTVGGLGVALVPLLGMMSGAVNPDAMLYAVTAALFFCLARAFRRGLTRAGAFVLGAVLAVGLMTKLNFVGVAPGAILGLIVLSVRAARTLGRAAYISLAGAIAVAISPAAVYVGAHLANGAPAFGIVSSAIGDMHRPLLSELSYIWQLYLPRLPGMQNDFQGLFPPTQFWFNGYVGLYGWLDTTFPSWVYEAALIPAALIAGLCLRSLIASAAALRTRLLELAVYGLMCVGLMALVGADSYIRFPEFESEFAQFRYMLPLVPLLGIVLALAARGAGSRWGPVVGAGIVMLFLGHDVFSQLQEVARYYG